MKGTSEIRNRIESVSDTVKITQAMYAISAAKMPRISANAAAAKTYLAKAEKGVRLLPQEVWKDSIFGTSQDEPKRTAWLILGADKGLCSDYNERVFAKADNFLASIREGQVYCIGHTVHEYLVHNGIAGNDRFIYMMQYPIPQDAAQIADHLMERVTKEEISSVKMIYTTANKMYDQAVVTETLLPLDIAPDGKEMYMPDCSAVEMIRHYLCAKVYAVLCDAQCALNYKRMTSMQTATNNGNEMLEELTLQYNRIRQTSITNELNDASGAKMANEDRT